MLALALVIFGNCFLPDFTPQNTFLISDIAEQTDSEETNDTEELEEEADKLLTEITAFNQFHNLAFSLVLRQDYNPKNIHLDIHSPPPEHA